MSTVAEFERDCAYCRQPITLKWKYGLIPSEGVCLVVDQFFHDKCWDKYSANYNGNERSQARKDNGGQARVIDQVDPIEETQANSRRTMSARNVAFGRIADLQQPPREGPLSAALLPFKCSCIPSPVRLTMRP
jgi:hypothetical protein